MKTRKLQPQYGERKVKLETDTETRHISADFCCLTKLNQGKGTIWYVVDYELQGLQVQDVFMRLQQKHIPH